MRTTTCTTCDGSGVCYHCNGEGFRDGLRCMAYKGEEACKTCLGTGRREVRGIDGQDYLYCSMSHGSGKCTNCNGSGNAQYGNHCDICGGDGLCSLYQGKGVTRLRGF